MSRGNEKGKKLEVIVGGRECVTRRGEGEERKRENAGDNIRMRRSLGRGGQRRPRRRRRSR